MKQAEHDSSNGSGGTPQLGHILVAERAVTAGAVDMALEVQRRASRYRPLGEVLIEHGVLTRRQLHRVLTRYRKRLRLGEILVRAGLLTEPQLAQALRHQATSGERLGQVLRHLNMVSDEAVRNAVCAQLNIPTVDLDRMTLERGLTRLSTREFAVRHRLLPVASTASTLTIAMEDPTDFEVIADLESCSGRTVSVAACAPAALMRAIDRLYGPGSDPGGLTGTRLDLIPADDDPQPATREYSIETRRADELVRRVIGLALEWRASDIHLETLDRRLQARLRIDGELQALDLDDLEQGLSAVRREVISRIKVLANLDIAERRRPQDGSFRARRETGVVNIRVSIIPGYYGESVVLRLLDPRQVPASLDTLGFSPAVRHRLGQLLSSTTGMLLLTGPTGCGKSTTLHAALLGLHRPGIRVLTVEDPIEYVYDHFSQCEVNERLGNTFASYLRSFLRHDPEVMMVGEIRDVETAEMAVRAAQTGHLILSTLHTVDSVGAVTRLVDLNVDRTLVTASLLGVMSQRLVRLICESCKEIETPAPELIREFFADIPQGYTWYRGGGCPQCHFTGYRGRTAVGELWVPSERDVRLINRGASPAALRESAIASTITMAEDVESRLRDGMTNLSELIRTLPNHAVQQFRLRRGSTAGVGNGSFENPIEVRIG